MIVINLDVMMAKRKISLNELSERVGIMLAVCRRMPYWRKAEFSPRHKRLINGKPCAPRHIGAGRVPSY